ncbi:MOSC domain-containing protein [Rhodobaculum claviforme]|uniref:MOSC domain-containing protein n=1 Tax=Rhodobaculum claviforme TaxID=1549854 RepID=A0A934TK75_9RHOB|nr:MOSC domain-containing protein [Rhodobaculum claviforme]MBK5926727.1 hypothetical protein [Rhodobaculum claviforme]
MIAPGARLAHIVRHPIKSVGHEELAAAALTPGHMLPGDRAWAVAHAAARLEGEGWAPKGNFLRGVASAELMAVRAESGPWGLRLHHPRAGTLEIDPGTGGDALLAWLAPLWPEGRPAPDRLVRAPATGMGDVPDPWVSVLSLVSLRALGQRMGQALSIHRFRGNLWLDGLAPWEEFDLVGRRLRIGTALLEVRDRITRCKATTANPETGRFDADTIGALSEGWGHTDFGIYAEVLAGGEVRTGDTVEVLA